MYADKRSYRQIESTRPIWYALVANLAVMAVKSIGALYTGSGTLLAEALHSLADTGNQALLLYGLHRAKAQPSFDHPFGHGRDVYFWSFVLALLLFSLGGLLSIYGGIQKFSDHAGVRNPWIAIGIIGFALAAQGLSLRVALAQANRSRRGRSMLQWFRETRRSDLLVIVTEDSAALVGLIIALAALGATVLFDDPLYDAIGSIAIGTLLVIVALALAAEIKSLLVGESASPRTRLAIRRILEECPEVLAVRSLAPPATGAGCDRARAGCASSAVPGYARGGRCGLQERAATTNS
ncbi:MAG: cation diffusion facilitator family transporter [Burkholderiales bacterium]